MEGSSPDWVANCIQILDGSVSLGVTIYPIIWSMLIVRKIMRF